jgi:hypothetical protein
MSRHKRLPPFAMTGSAEDLGSNVIRRICGHVFSLRLTLESGLGGLRPPCV